MSNPSWGYKDGESRLFDSDEDREKAGFSDSPQKKVAKKKAKKKVVRKKAKK
ncbi:MAG: hypothetical protein GY942_15490 [Aestuariibacter sp.]|nr:hypothetical protein [Aestuariibacter sp.]